MSAEPVILRAPGGELEATFLPELGMVGSSLRHRGEELLALRGGPEAYARSKSTFGIPLLHPWANRLSAWAYDLDGRLVELDPGSAALKRDGDTGLPIHGAVAAVPYWTLAGRGSGRDPTWLEAELDYSAHPELDAVFPFHHRLILRVELTGQTLTLNLTLIPTGEDPVPVAFGFHPYFALPGSRRSDWELELPVARRAVLGPDQIPTGELEDVAPHALDGRLGQRSFDDSFEALSGDPPRFSVADGRRRVTVAYAHGYPVAQVYAPATAALVAFEPMTAPVDALRTGRGLRHAAPGRPFTAEFAIQVEAD